MNEPIESHMLARPRAAATARVNIWSISIKPIMLEGPNVHCLPLGRKYQTIRNGTLTKTDKIIIGTNVNMFR